MGLDIESGFLAAAELGNGNGPVLRRAATEALLPGLFHEGEVTDAEGLAEQLRNSSPSTSSPSTSASGWPASAWPCACSSCR